MSEEKEMTDREKTLAALAKMNSWADNVIDWKEAMGALPEGKLKDEKMVMRESLGVELEEAWGIYDLLQKGEEVVLSGAEAKALGRWLTVNIRSRAEIQVRAEMLEKMLAYMQLREDLRAAGMVGEGDADGSMTRKKKKKEEILH
jgi:hypothetical protein